MPRKKAINKTRQEGTRPLEKGEKLHYTKSMVKKRGKIYWRVIEKPLVLLSKITSLKKTQEHLLDFKTNIEFGKSMVVFLTFFVLIKTSKSSEK